MTSLSLLITPPEDRNLDTVMVRDFLNAAGGKAVCGGSSAGMVGEFLGTEPEIDLVERDITLPPAGRLPGIDIVSEGVFTLEAVLRELGTVLTRDGRRENSRTDAAGRLAGMLLEAETVNFFLGTAPGPENVTGKDAKVLPDKKQTVLDIRECLGAMNKSVNVYIY